VIVELQNANSIANYLDAWIDFNRDGDWNDPGEQIFTSLDLGTTNGGRELTFTIPQDAGANVVNGNSYARFRVSSGGGLNPTGVANDGEVEDYEVTIVSADPLLVDTLLDESDGNFSAGDFSLREAIELANARTGADEIQFAPGLSGGTITLTLGELLITDDLTITGLGASNLTVSGGDASRVLNLQSAALNIDGLTITAGRTMGNGQGGGAIRSNGTLQVSNSIVSNSRRRRDLSVRRFVNDHRFDDLGQQHFRKQFVWRRYFGKQRERNHRRQHHRRKLDRFRWHIFGPGWGDRGDFRKPDPYRQHRFQQCEFWGRLARRRYRGVSG
jgi:hypothetical protein